MLNITVYDKSVVIIKSMYQIFYHSLGVVHIDHLRRYNFTVAYFKSKNMHLNHDCTFIFILYSSELESTYISITASLNYCGTMNLQLPTIILFKIFPIDDLNMIQISH